jgi:hypothetical protein
VHQVWENAIEVTFGAGIENIRLKAKAMGLPETKVDEHRPAAYFVVDKAVHKTASSSKRHQGVAGFEPRFRHRPNVPIERYAGRCSSMPIRKGRKVSRIIGRILLTLAVFAVTGFVLLVLIGLWDSYEKDHSIGIQRAL